MSFAEKTGDVFQEASYTKLLPFRCDRLVLRPAYGISTDLVILNANLDAAFNPPFTTQTQILNPTGALTIQNILNQSPAVSLPTATFLARNLKDAYMQQWNFDLQGQPAKDVVLDIGYVGTRGNHLVSLRNINQPLPGQPLPYPQFAPSVYITDNSGDSSYNALQVRAEKRSAAGGTFLASYTFSRSIDTGSSLFGSAAGSGQQYGGDVGAERGLSDFNASHRFLLSYVYELPVGAGHSVLSHGAPGKILGHWQVSGIFTWQTGQPFTVDPRDTAERDSSERRLSSSGHHEQTISGGCTVGRWVHLTGRHSASSPPGQALGCP